MTSIQDCVKVKNQIELNWFHLGLYLASEPAINISEFFAGLYQGLKHDVGEEKMLVLLDNVRAELVTNETDFFKQYLPELWGGDK